MPFIHSLAILGGILFSALLLMLLLFRALRDELARWWAEGGALDEGQDEDLDGPDSPAPRPLRDFAPRPGAAAGDATDEEPPRP